MKKAYIIPLVIFLLFVSVIPCFAYNEFLTSFDLVADTYTFNSDDSFSISGSNLLDVSKLSGVTRGEDGSITLTTYYVNCGRFYDIFPQLHAGDVISYNSFSDSPVNSVFLFDSNHWIYNNYLIKPEDINSRVYFYGIQGDSCVLFPSFVLGPNRATVFKKYFNYSLSSTFDSFLFKFFTDSTLTTPFAVRYDGSTADNIFKSGDFNFKIASSEDFYIQIYRDALDPRSTPFKEAFLTFYSHLPDSLVEVLQVDTYFVPFVAFFAILSILVLIFVFVFLIKRFTGGNC